MRPEFWISLLASGLAALVTTLGLWAVRRHEERARRHLPLVVAFAAGVLVSAPLSHLLPHALRLSPQAPAWVLTGFLLLHFFNYFFTAQVCERDRLPGDALGWLAMVGIGFHSFVDGFIYAIGFKVSLVSGFVAAVGMVLHEFPEGVVIYLLLVRGGWSPRRAGLLAFLAAAVSTPAGMLVSYPFVARLEGGALGNWLALSAGSLLYVGASHLLPETVRERNWRSLIAFIAGVSLAALPH